MDLVSLWPQALFHGVSDRLRVRLWIVRGGADARSDGALPLDPRGGWGCDDPVFASDPDGDLPARRTGSRDGDVGRWSNGGSSARTDAWWVDHRQLELALELLYQP